jgi:hypothetical protein
MLSDASCSCHTIALYPSLTVLDEILDTAEKRGGQCGASPVSRVASPAGSG